MGVLRAMLTRTLLLIVTLALAPLVGAEQGVIERPADAPSSTVAWTTELKRALADADPGRGAQLSQTKMCASCHGNDGVSWSEQWPSLAGLQADYLYKMLVDYAEGDRAQTRRAYLMHSISQELTDQDRLDLAAFYASFDLPAALDAEPSYSEATVKLVRDGDGKRLLAPCASCHGPRGQGQKYGIPALAGQRPEYFRKTMQEYKDGTRRNDVYSRMRVIARTLTDDEIAELANYYATLDGNR
ncbi:MAG: c-type cytochrome [Thioalkalivibrio sp.]|nr:c-type cytochrome [Thioalkalivibrio sp.]